MPSKEDKARIKKRVDPDTGLTHREQYYRRHRSKKGSQARGDEGLFKSRRELGEQRMQRHTVDAYGVKLSHPNRQEKKQRRRRPPSPQ